MSESNAKINKGGIARQNVDRYIISSNQVVSYLQDQLGFPIGADFLRWTGFTANHSYVRMRVGIANKDIVAQRPDATTYVERVLQDNSNGGFDFKSTVNDVLKKFMYPDQAGFNDLLQNENAVQNMHEYGLYGDRLLEIIKYSRPAYVKDQKMWRLYLRPEKIIKDMLSDPATDKIDGIFAITGVFGTESDTIRWEIEISKGGISNTELGVISIDKLFSL